MFKQARTALVLSSLAMLAACSQGAAPGTGQSSASTASLENTYWKLMTVGGAPVTVAEGQREPYLVLQAPDKRVAGYGGCNRFSGSYSTGTEALTFGPIAATKMACLQGGEVEPPFFEALGKAATWKIAGERLDLFDAAGHPVAAFESRYMQ